MNKNPILNAAGAALYIAGIVFIIDTMMSSNTEGEGEAVLLIPITMLSLFVLSAAVMGFLFIVEPLRLYFEGQKQEAVAFFLKTVGAFALITALFVASLFFVVGGVQ